MWVEGGGYSRTINQRQMPIREDYRAEKMVELNVFFFAVPQALGPVHVHTWVHSQSVGEE